MRGSDARGFTLVELLVVISIIGMLSALLLPAVQAARDTARRATCTNNQRQIGMALLEYESKYGRFPGYANWMSPPNTASTRAGRPVGWMFSILPFLERNDLYEAWCRVPEVSEEEDEENLYPNSYLKIAVCPSDVSAGMGTHRESASALSYVVNCGLSDCLMWPEGASAPVLDWGANGVFQFNIPLLYFEATIVNGAAEAYAIHVPFATRPQRVSNSYISGGDGTATTLMLSENIDARSWTDRHEAAVGFTWQAGLDENGRPAANPCPVGDNLPLPLKHINEAIGEFETYQDYSYSRPSSYHRGGVVATFCDGHTGFLSEALDYLVYCQLMTPRGKSARPAPTIGRPHGPFVPFADLSEHPELGIYNRAILNEGDF